MARPTRFERVTFAFGGQGSIYVYVQTGSGLLDQSRAVLSWQFELSLQTVWMYMDFARAAAFGTLSR
jgi:hypothetical protein